jgi:hypothetical protein
MHAQVKVTRTISVPSEKAWRAISGIGGLDRWFSVVASCRVEGEGVGAIRTLGLADGGELVDVIADIDASRRRLRYVRTKHPFPVSKYVGEVEVHPAGEGRSEITWSVELDVDEPAREAVTAFLHGALSDGVDGLEKDLAQVGG